MSLITTGPGGQSMIFGMKLNHFLLLAGVLGVVLLTAKYFKDDSKKNQAALEQLLQQQQAQTMAMPTEQRGGGGGWQSQFGPQPQAMTPGGESAADRINRYAGAIGYGPEMAMQSQQDYGNPYGPGQGGGYGGYGGAPNNQRMMDRMADEYRQPDGQSYYSAPMIQGAGARTYDQQPMGSGGYEDLKNRIRNDPRLQQGDGGRRGQQMRAPPRPTPPGEPYQVQGRVDTSNLGPVTHRTASGAILHAHGDGVNKPAADTGAQPLNFSVDPRRTRHKLREALMYR